MSEITDPAILALAAADETAWEGFDESHVLMQRDCPNCDHGLLWAPARFCPTCSGSGFLVRRVEIGAKEGETGV